MLSEGSFQDKSPCSPGPEAWGHFSISATTPGSITVPCPRLTAVALLMRMWESGLLCPPSPAAPLSSQQLTGKGVRGHGGGWRAVNTSSFWADLVAGDQQTKLCPRER